MSAHPECAVTRAPQTIEEWLSMLSHRHLISSQKLGLRIAQRDQASPGDERRILVIAAVCTCQSRVSRLSVARP
jgi:hypothetical protein